MPSVLATSTLVEHLDVHDLPTALPRARRARQGFWRTLVQHVAWLCVQRPHQMQLAYAVSHHRLETPEKLFVRQYPSSYLLGFSGV
jgi:hypothetical protein